MLLVAYGCRSITMYSSNDAEKYFLNWIPDLHKRWIKSNKEQIEYNKTGIEWNEEEIEYNKERIEYCKMKIEDYMKMIETRKKEIEYNKQRIEYYTRMMTDDKFRRFVWWSVAEIESYRKRIFTSRRSI